MDFNDHNLVTEREILEKYILGELPSDMEEGFEEHMLFCKECRDNYNKLQTTILGAQTTLEHTVYAKKKSNENTKRILASTPFKIAAGIVVIISLSVVLMFLVKTTRNPSVVASYSDSLSKYASDSDSVGKTHINSDSIERDHLYEKNNQSAGINQAKQPDLYADVFKPLSYLEGAIDNQLRSETLKILSPKINAEFKEPAVILFDWEPYQNASLSLVIKDNKGKTVFESVVIAPFTYMRTLHAGLYYWQLNTEDETIYTGKFILRE